MSLILALAALLTFAGLATGARLSLRDRATPRGAASGRPGLLAAVAKAGTPDVADPIAHVANVNTVVPAFELGFSYSQVHVGELKLQEVLIKPVDPGESIKGGCDQCTGSGSFLPYTIKNHLFTEATRGNIFLTGKTKIAEALVRPGQIGRFKIYGVSVGPPTNTRLLAQGCIAADAIPTAGGTPSAVLNALLHPRSLPQVSCSGNPTGDSGTFFRPPLELSTHNATGQFTGHANGARWLSVFQGHPTCGPDALAEARRTANHVFWHVHGNFNVGFTTAPVSRAGFFCAYLQTGSTFGGIPDGKVSLMWNLPYYAGDTVAIGGPTSVTAGDTVDNTFAGHASAAEELWTFDATAPCRATAQAEYATQASFGVGNTPENGDFSVNVTSRPFTTAGTGYRCAYLQVGAPTKKGVPTGPTLATASLQIAVS